MNKNKIEKVYKFLLFWDLINLIPVMDLFFFSNRAPLQVAQAAPIAAQKTSWLAHLHLWLRGNVDDKGKFVPVLN
jgi:hypothetical protein